MRSGIGERGQVNLPSEPAERREGKAKDKG